MVDLVPINIAAKPGCKRDGTTLESDNYIDNQWCRYQLKAGLPRKMGGYKRLSNELSGVTRGLHVYNNDQNTYAHAGWASGLERFILDSLGNVSAIADRTPVGFAASSNNLWQFDLLYQATLTTSVLLAHAAPNMAEITSSTQTPVYFGDVTGVAALTATASPSVAGGTFALGPYAVSYDHDGVINYTGTVNDVTAAWQSVRPTASKLVFGLPIRAGAGNGPSGLIWGVEALVRMTFIGGTATWNFDNITSAYSLLSSQAIIEYDGIYYWPGIDHFMSFNGVIQEVENSMNSNWFYDNLNYDHSQKVFAFKIPRWGEIWWCYPRGSATECTHAVIYNVRLSRMFGYGVWYDVQLPNGGLSAAQFARVFRRPLVTGVDLDASTSKYKLWELEFGTDEIDGSDVRAIQSYFESSFFFGAELQTPTNKSIYVDYIEPDFIQAGDMSVQITGSRSNARAPDATSTPVTFPATATSSADQVVYLREQRRQPRIRFESNTVGGNYEMGVTLAQCRSGDDRITS